MKHFYRICLVYPGIQDMDAIGNIHEVRFLNIYTQSSIISYILPLTIIIVLAMKVVGFSKFWQGLSNTFAMHYDHIKDYTWIILEQYFLFQTKKFIRSWFKSWKEQHKNNELASLFKYA